MTSHSTRLILAASILFTISAATTVAVQNGDVKPDEATASPAKDDELATAGKKTTEAVCTQCHGMEEVTSGPRRTPGEWNEVVTAMVENGADATDKDIDAVKKYLTRYYGRVEVNTAPASDLSSVLGLSPKDADAIVEYRKAHGKFADAAALSNVPGIDKAKIDAQPDALRFD